MLQTCLQLILLIAMEEVRVYSVFTGELFPFHISVPRTMIPLSFTEFQ